MTACQRCSGKAQLFLCRVCESDLREMLLGLPKFIDYLRDACLGQTRLGESARRSSDLTTPMLCNESASRHLDNIHAMLVRWVQDICETRGVNYPSPRVVPASFIGPLFRPVDAADKRQPQFRGHATGATSSAAIWLANNTGAIACDEAAGMCFSEIRQAVDVIESVINRPVRPRDLGPCPTIVAHHQKCALRLSAPRKAVEVTCPDCKATHQVRELIDILCNELEYWPLSSVDILGSRTSDLPGALDYYGLTLARSTFHYWRKHGMLTVRGYRNRDTLAVMPERENDKDDPVFYLADVLLLLGHVREEKAG